jgi:hypothetical protein
VTEQISHCRIRACSAKAALVWATSWRANHTELGAP